MRPPKSSSTATAVATTATPVSPARHIEQRYDAACADLGTSYATWRGLVAELDEAADSAPSMLARMHLRDLADDCRGRADRRSAQLAVAS